jgi:hypothetical protein
MATVVAMTLTTCNLSPIMKSIAFFFCAFVPTFSTLMATPDAGTEITERFLCSDSANFVILRTECHNPGSYYTSRTKTWFIEHSKSPTSPTPQRKTLMLDQTDSVDAENTHKLTSTLHFKEQKTSLGDILERYQVKPLTPWTQEQTAMLRFDKTTGLTEFKSQRLWEGFKQAKKAGETGNQEDEFRLVGVGEDQNCIFLTICKGVDENSETTMVCISASISRNVHALRELEPFHLSAGSYSSAKDALSRFDSLQKTNVETFQVWSVFQAATGVTEYAVVMANTASFLRADILGERQKLPDQPSWMPISSEGFRELIGGSTP